MRRTESTVRLLVARAGRGTAELLGLAAARVRDEEVSVVGHEEVLDLALRGLVDVLLVERHDGLGDRLADGVDLGVRAGQKREGRGPRCWTLLWTEQITTRQHPVTGPISGFRVDRVMFPNKEQITSLALFQSRTTSSSPRLKYDAKLTYTRKNATIFPLPQEPLQLS